MTILKCFLCVVMIAVSKPSQSTDAGLLAPSTRNVPSIVVTIKPIYGLVAALTEGVLTPTLLCEKRGSTHTLSLAPSDIRTLSNASLVIWVGPSYETMMAKPLQKAIPKNQLLTLEDAPGLQLYPQRVGGLFAGHACSHHDHRHEHSAVDGHFWLDIDNAKHCARFIAETLSAKYPAHKDSFSANLQRLERELNALKIELVATLAPIRGKIALIDHDSLYYMERQFGFTIKGVLSEEPNMPPSPKHLGKLTDELDANIDEKLINVFFFSGSPGTKAPLLLQKLATAYQISMAPLTYEGDDVAKTTIAYEACLRGIATQLLNGFGAHMSAAQP
jgi:zinc transport system substrate-binding protein